MLPLASRVQQYLRETLGIPISGLRPWAGENDLPYFLRDAFEFEELDIMGMTVLLALDRHPGESSISDIRVWLSKIRSVAGHPALYVTDALQSYERRRLIEQKVPFAVPGNQLYLPDLGIDLREHFRQRKGVTDSQFSPSTQALLIAALLSPRWEQEWHPGETASMLGYTAMTLSRSVRELAAAGLAQVHKAGRSQYLAMMYSARETWERAANLLRSPVQRTVWTDTPIRAGTTMRLAGLSALAHHSMLNEPRAPVYAISRTTWQELKKTVENLPGTVPGAYEVQVWSYSPLLEPGSQTVDPLSLILSLRDSTDERIQSALEEVKDKLPW